jgi:hypothetical protein
MQGEGEKKKGKEEWTHVWRGNWRPSMNGGFKEKFEISLELSFYVKTFKFCSRSPTV